MEMQDYYKLKIPKKKKPCKFYNISINNTLGYYGDYTIIKRTLYDQNFENIKLVNQYKFEYEFDRFIKYHSDNKCNVKITFTDSHGDKLECYTKFNWWKRRQMNYYFGKMWVQQPNNIMWLVNITIAFFAVLMGIVNVYLTIHKK